MQFISTRGGMEPLGFTDVLLSGLAPDGGLAIPSEVPQLALEDLEDLRDLSYAELAARIIGLYATDIDAEDLRTLTAQAYGPQRFPSPVVPLTCLDDVAQGLGLVGLSEGPTMAFKDLAMQFLGRPSPSSCVVAARSSTSLARRAGTLALPPSTPSAGRTGERLHALPPGQDERRPACPDVQPG